MDRIAIAVAALLLAAGCQTGPRRVIVASKNFTEQLVLGEIVAQHLERRGLRVERKMNLSGTLLAHQAMLSAGIDVYPEYSGTALTAVLKQSPSGADAAAVRSRVTGEYRERFQLIWMPPLGFNNTFAMAVRSDEPFSTLSEAAKGKAWRLGAGYEFLQRPDGLAGLVRTYGLKLDGEPVSMDLGLLYRALESRQVGMAAANSTDAQLAGGKVRVLRDDRGYFPPYECSLVVRQEALSRFPLLRGALEELSGTIDDAAMRRLNAQAEGGKRPVADVAREFLAALR